MLITDFRGTIASFRYSSQFFKLLGKTGEKGKEHDLQFTRFLLKTLEINEQKCERIMLKKKHRGLRKTRGYAKIALFFKCINYYLKLVATELNVVQKEKLLPSKKTTRTGNFSG